MTVAEMIAKRTVALRTILHESGQAIHYKGGTPADDLSGLQDAIRSIPSGGGELPELTDPAEVGHVLAGKEYIDASGTKKTGTLVVCDSIEEVETIGVPGVGLSVDFESPADGSAGNLMLREPDLASENIKSGVSIFGVVGTAKILRVETGTITPAEDAKAITIPSTGKVINIVGVSVPAETGYAISASYSKGDYDSASQIGGYFRYSSPTTLICAGITVLQQDGKTTFDTSNAARLFAAGVTYQWTAYNWEDDA